MVLKETNKQIVINAGHHDNDPGKIIITEEHLEAEHARLIRDEVVQLLEQAGVFIVHAVPDNLNLTKSIQWSNEKLPEKHSGLAIDIHLNAHSNKAARGAEAYYWIGTVGKEIASTISKGIADALLIPDRGAKLDSETHVGSLGWLRYANANATLAEVCFMTNEDDWAALTATGGHARAAQGIVDGINKLFDIQKTIEPPVEDGYLAKLIQIFIMFKFFRNAEEVALEVKERREEEILQKKNVVGVGVGPRNGDGETSVVVLVNKKEELGALSDEDMVPEYIDGVRTDVYEIGDIEAMACTHCDKERPVHGGLSAIWQKGTACTLGAIVYKGDKVYALQNTHCANPHWKGAKLGDKVIQPSGSDGGSKRGKKDVIGVSAEYLELRLDNKTMNPFDSALVDLEVEATPLYQEKIGTIKAEIKDAKVGDVVWKSGRTTGVQQSKVIATNVTVGVNYGKGLVGRFNNQILAENKDGYFTSGGDSSSLVVNSDRHPVGQIFAGSTRVAIFSPIRPIMEHFGITFEPKVTEGYMAIAVQGGENYADIIPELVQEGAALSTEVNLNFRKSAGLAGDKIDVVKKGAVIEVLEDAIVKDGYVWVKVRTK